MILRCLRIGRVRVVASISKRRWYSIVLEKPEDFVSTTPLSTLNERAKVNHQLAHMIKERHDPPDIYKFFIANLRYIDYEMAEVFLFNLMLAQDISASTALLHALFTSTDFVMSNELWSQYINDVCGSANHLGSLLIYHQLVENYTLHENNRSAFTRENNHFPFLLSPSILLQLAVIFQRNKDSERCLGILSYFKRFYSYVGYKSIYKSLHISVVESYADSGDFPTALKMFNRLAGTMRGHASDKSNWESMNSLLKRAAFMNHVQRRKNIEGNFKLDLEYPTDVLSPLDELQLKDGGDLFDPLIERNVYTTSSIHGIPLVNGSLLMNDLPNFSSLILRHTKSIMKSKDTSPIIPFIKVNHSLVHIFFTKALCDLGYIEEAVQILKKLPYEYPTENPRVLIPDDNFFCILQYIKQSINPNTSNVKYLNLVGEIAKVYDSLQKDGKLSLQLYSQILSTLLCSPDVKHDSIMDQLKKFAPNDKIILKLKDYQRITDLLEVENDYSCILCIE